MRKANFTPGLCNSLLLSTARSLMSELAEPLIREAMADGGVDAAEPRDKPASYTASLRAGAMLGQMCERSLIEHQLAACYFAFRNFCEDLPLPGSPRPLTTRERLRSILRATLNIQGCSLSP